MKNIIALALTLAGACLSQNTTQNTTQTTSESHTVVSTSSTGSGPNTFFFMDDHGAGGAKVMAGEFNLELQVVKGQPYTADAITETTQTLPDGNHIVRKETASVARDSEGRTRREQVLSGVGPWSTPADPGKVVFINDPVSGINFVLEPSHVAHKNAHETSSLMLDMKVKRDAEARVTTLDVAPNAFLSKVSSDKDAAENAKVEQLPPQIIEGVQAEGTRRTTTIPAGKIGNERPIEIVSERWFSPELQTVLMTKSSDPRTGEMVFRLTNIQRSEPAPSLFEIPADYKIDEMKDGDNVMRKVTIDVKK
jgi:hypothetical protein